MEFPYTALKLSSGKYSEFNNIDDVYEELSILYDKCLNQGFPIGKSLYKQSAFFVDNALLVDSKMQRRITEYTYCKKFNTPLYSTMNNTPANIVDEFMIIEEEYAYCKNEEEQTLNKESK